MLSPLMNYFLYLFVSRKEKSKIFPARFELATFRVLGRRDNHYTTETTVYNKGKIRGIIVILSLGRTRKFILLLLYNGVGEGWMEPLPGVFNMLQYFETMLPLVENLWSS